MSRGAAAAVGLMLAALATPANSSDAIAVDERIEYYRVEGRTVAQLAEQLQRLGPLRTVGGGRSTALTHWELAWRHTPEMRDGMCELVDLDVRVILVVTLPAWSPPAAVDRGLVAKWRTFMARVREHEDVHRRHGLQAAAALQQVVAALPPQSDCRQLSKLVAVAGHQAVRRYARISRAYDVATDYGVKKGVRL